MTLSMPAVILAGGLSSRMGGGDKGLCQLGGRPILSHIIDRIGPQAGRLAINANGNADRFAQFGLAVISDRFPGQPGPLAGILAAMLWAHSLGETEVGTVTSDVPFLPHDLFLRLGPGPAYAQSGGRDHPTIGLWPTSLAPRLQFWLEVGNRRVMDWARSMGARAVPFAGTPDPFFNINTPEDLAWAKDHAHAV